MKSAIVSSLVLIASIPALASVAVNSPNGGSPVASPFHLSASSASCSAQGVTTMGYSFDGSADTTLVNGDSIETQVASSPGAHTLHVKSWSAGGAACVTDVELTVAAGAGNTTIPGNAIAVSHVQALSGWTASNDSGASGGSSGWMKMVSSPSLSGSAREFGTSYSKNGDERYSVAFGDDEAATNFFYDAWIYLTSSAKDIGNVEMDLNQTMANGDTVIFGFQCDGWHGTWDYTANLGSVTTPKDAWIHTGAACNPRNWTTNAWHHVQVSYSRDDAGAVTYNYVVLDGTQQTIGATAPSAFALGWAPVLLTNFQVDGLGASGSNTVYLDNLTIYRW